MDQATSLQKDLKAEPHLPSREDEGGLGLENASLQWKEVVGVEKQDKTKNGVLSPSALRAIPSPTSSDDVVPPPSAFAHSGRRQYCLERWHNKARSSCPTNTGNGDMHAISHDLRGLSRTIITPLMRSGITPLRTVSLGSLILEDGDATDIGARGVSLLGGQKDLRTF